MTSPAPLDPGLERQPGEPLGSYVSRLEDTHIAYLRSAQLISARLALVEAACTGDAPPAPLVLHAPSGAQAGQEGASALPAAPESPFAFRPPRETTVIAQFERWVAGEMARDRGYLAPEIAEATGINEASVKAYARRLWKQGLLRREEGRLGSYRYFHPERVVRDLRAEVLGHLRALAPEQQEDAAAIAVALGGGLTGDDLAAVLQGLVGEGVVDEVPSDDPADPRPYYWMAEVAE